MDFLTGFGITLLLSMAFAIIVVVSKLLPKEFALLPIYGMIAVDGACAAVWYFGLVELVESIKAFKFGMASAFMFTSFAKAIFLVIYTQKRELV